MADPSTSLRLVCFDLGGVVVRICQSWGEGCAAAGLDDRDGDAVRRVAASDAWRALNVAYQSGALDLKAFAERFAALLDGLYTPEEVIRVHRAWILGAYEGVEMLVEDIHAAGLETAVLSNTCHEHWGQLVTMPVLRRLRNRIGSHQVAACKPDPAAYRAVETRTGFRGAEILFFDDLEANVEAARRLGWWSECVDPGGDTAEQMRARLESVAVLSS